MDGPRDFIPLDCCPMCQGPLLLKSSQKSGNSYQSCPKSQGGCGWWTGQKEGEVTQKQSFPQKRNFSVNQTGQGNFRGGPKYSKPNPSYTTQLPSPPIVQPHKPTVVVEAKPESDINCLLLELFRERLQKDENLEKLVLDLSEEIGFLKSQLETILTKFEEKK